MLIHHVSENTLYKCDKLGGVLSSELNTARCGIPRVTWNVKRNVQYLIFVFLYEEKNNASKKGLFKRTDVTIILTPSPDVAKVLTL